MIVPCSNQRLFRCVPYSGKLLREKSFANYAVLWLFAKVFSVKFWGVVSFGAAKASKSCFHQFTKVYSLKSFPLYSILVSCIAAVKVLCCWRMRPIHTLYVDQWIPNVSILAPPLVEVLAIHCLKRRDAMGSTNGQSAYKYVTALTFLERSKNTNRVRTSVD